MLLVKNRLICKGRFPGRLRARFAVDSNRAWMLLVSNRSRIFTISVCTLFLASVTWNVRQYNQLAQQHLRDLVEEEQHKALAEAQALRVQERVAKKAERDAADARVQQLYQEINSLSRINDVLAQPVRAQALSSNSRGCRRQCALMADAHLSETGQPRLESLAA